MKYPFLEAKERLIRIMGTFDLATGHADTMDELLDSLESELRDVLGYYRTALKIKEDEPVVGSKMEHTTKPVFDTMKQECPYTGDLLRGAFYDGWLKAEKHTALEVNDE